MLGVIYLHWRVDGSHKPLTEQAAEFPPGPLEDAAESEYVITGNHIDHNRSHVVSVGTLPFFLHGRVLHTTVSWGVPDEELIPSLVLLLWALQWRIMRWSHTPWLCDIKTRCSALSPWGSLSSPTALHPELALCSACPPGLPSSQPYLKLVFPKPARFPYASLFPVQLSTKTTHLYLHFLPTWPQLFPDLVFWIPFRHGSLQLPHEGNSGASSDRFSLMSVTGPERTAFVHCCQAYIWILGCPVWSPKLDSVILMGPFQLWIFYVSVYLTLQMDMYGDEVTVHIFYIMNLWLHKIEERQQCN